MLKFLRQHKAEQIVVIIDDISRLARGIKAHLDLRNAIAQAGGKLESPSIEFGEDSDSVLVENLLASVSQHQRQKNAEQVKNRMRARLMNGYWIGKAPFGYRYAKTDRHGKLLVRNEPLASIVQKALEGYAAGRFESRPEMLLFLERHPEFPRGYDGKIHYQRVDDMLKNPLYCGIISFPSWGINTVEGHHEALISVTTWQKIQERLKDQAKTTARVDVWEDFPLRGFVSCECCNRPMTASWSKGRARKYAYYHCFTVGCPEYKQSIRKEKIEIDFRIMLDKIFSAKNMHKLAVAPLKHLWEQKEKTLSQSLTHAEGEIEAINKKVRQLMERIIAADSPSVVKAYEEHIKSLEMKKAELAESLQNKGAIKPFEETFRTALEYLKNPMKYWDSERIGDKKTFLKLTFKAPVSYCRKGGFRTVVTSCLFSLFGGFSYPNKVLVEPISTA